MSNEKDFDEAWYLRSNPDVARAVKAGQLRSGYQHYLDHEGRASHPTVTAETAAISPKAIGLAADKG